MRGLFLALFLAAATTAGAEPIGPAPSLRLAFVGDIMFGRFKGDGFQAIHAEKHDLFAAIRDDLVADLAMANLETPVMRNPPPSVTWGTPMRFVAPPERVQTLLGAGIGYVTVANNHAEDMQQDGLVETRKILGELGITAVGTASDQAPAIRAETVTLKGRRLAFVAATVVRNSAPRPGPLIPHVEASDLVATVTPVIARARADHDLVIVAIHWGTEYRDLPHRWQVDAARGFVDAGADLVIGHHPHVVQPIERYGRGLIAYSLGNFVFDNLGDRVRRTGVLRLDYRFDQRCLDAEFRPAAIRGRPGYRPVPATGQLGREIATRLQALSKRAPHATTWRRDRTILRLTTCG